MSALSAEPEPSGPPSLLGRPNRLRRFAGVAAACAILGLPPIAAADTPGNRAPAKLDALGTVAYALAHTPALLEQSAQIASLDSTYTKLRAGEYPSATGLLQNVIQKSSNVGASTLGLAPVSNFSQNTAQLGSTYNLYNGAQQITARQARAQVEGARFELTRREEATTVTASDGFYQLAAQRGIVALDENDLRYQQELLAYARAAERVGRIAGVDVLRAQVAVARSESALVQARTDETNARESLAVQIGAPADSQFEVPAVVPEPSATTISSADLGAIAKSNRPEIAAARATFEASKLGDAAVDNDLRPTVAINAAFGSQVSPTNFVLEQQQIDQANAAAQASYLQQKALFPGLPIPAPAFLPPVNRRTPGFWQINLLSTFQIPLYDYGQRAAAHHAARAQIDSSLATLYNAYDTVQADVDSARRNLESAAEKLRLAKLSSQLAAESARVAQLQYKNGLISFTDATQTEQTSLSAQNDLVAARVSYVNAFVKLRAALAPADPAAAADLRGL